MNVDKVKSLVSQIKSANTVKLGSGVNEVQFPLSILYYPVVGDENDIIITIEWNDGENIFYVHFTGASLDGASLVIDSPVGSFIALKDIDGDEQHIHLFNRIEPIQDWVEV